MSNEQLPLFPEIPVDETLKTDEDLENVVAALCRPLNADDYPELDAHLREALFTSRRRLRRRVAQAIRATYLLAVKGKESTIVAVIDRLEA